MARGRALAVIGYCFVAACLLAYGLTERAPRRSKPATLFTYRQQTFHATRTVTVSGSILHSVSFTTYGGNIDVDWYDSSLAALQPLSGIYAELTIDKQQIASSLIGSQFGSSIHAPAVLHWAGSLPAGLHHLSIELARVDTGAEAPYIRSGHPGVDSLVVSQLGGGG